MFNLLIKIVKNQIPPIMDTTEQCTPRRVRQTERGGNIPKRTGRCLNAGRISRNPYLNFLREFRKNSCGMTAIETVKMGAKAWKSLPKEKKLQYTEQVIIYIFLR